MAEGGERLWELMYCQNVKTCKNSMHEKKEKRNGRFHSLYLTTQKPQLAQEEEFLWCDKAVSSPRVNGR